MEREWMGIAGDVVKYWRDNEQHVEPGVAPSLAPTVDGAGQRLLVPPGAPQLIDSIVAFSKKCPTLNMLLVLTAKSDKTPNVDKYQASTYSSTSRG